MQEYAAALDMPEEAVAQPGALMRALDEAGDIGEDEFAALVFDPPEVGMQRCEGIIGNLRLGGAARRKEGRFARIGQANDAGICNQLESQLDRQLLAGLAGIGMARRAVGRTLEMS